MSKDSRKKLPKKSAVKKAKGCGKKCSKKSLAKKSNPVDSVKTMGDDCPDEGCPIKRSPQILSTEPMIYIEPMGLSFWQRLKNWFFKP